RTLPKWGAMNRESVSSPPPVPLTIIQRILLPVSSEQPALDDGCRRPQKLNRGELAAKAILLMKLLREQWLSTIASPLGCAWPAGVQCATLDGGSSSAIFVAS